MGKNTIKIFSAERPFFFCFLKQLTGFKNWKFLNRKKNLSPSEKQLVGIRETNNPHQKTTGELFYSLLPYHSLPLLLPSFLPSFFILTPFKICCKAGWWYWILLAFACLKSFLFLHQFSVRSLPGTVILVVDFFPFSTLNISCISF